MELPLPPLHPQVPEMLSALKLRLVDVIQWNVFTCSPEDDKGDEASLVLKFGSDKRKAESLAYEIKVISEALPTLDQRQFERLVLPEYVNDGTTGGIRWMLTRRIPGQPLAHRWSEFAFKPDLLGGKAIDVSVAHAAVDALRDLRSVDIVTLPPFVRRFDFAGWASGYAARSAELVKRGLLERETVERAGKILASKDVSRYEGSMFTNGDFYPRNFIMLSGGKVALADWVGGIDPWEFVAMHAWLLMWGNARWQVEYVAALKDHFPIDLAEMQAGLLVGSFDLAYRWRETSEEQIGFARTQMLAYFRQCLDKEYVQEIFA